MAGRRTLPRRGLVQSQSTLVVAALIAAHGSSPPKRGFRMTDVRFFFYLFSNWLELDLLRATAPLELTQVRRLLSHLDAQGWIARPEERRFALTPEGLAELVGELASEGPARSFEEALFAACFARCYRHAVVQRAPPGRRAALARALSPARILRAAEARAARVALDLDARVQSSAAMQGEARALRRRGLTDEELAAALDRRDAYQLQHVRSFAEVMRALPPELLRFELEEGLAARSEVIFAPLAQQAKAQAAILAALRAALAAGDAD